jgi:hypothetical protein
VEALEDRQLLTATLSGGVLNYEGNHRGTRIEIIQRANSNQFAVFTNGKAVLPTGAVFREAVFMNGRNYVFFDGRDVGYIAVYAGGGNDFVRVDAPRFTGGVYLYGEAGNDHLVNYLSHRDQTSFLVGGDGNDILQGGSAKDYLFGDDFTTDGPNHGRDVLVGEDNADVLHGGGGDDLLIGGLAFPLGDLYRGIVGEWTPEFLESVRGLWTGPTMYEWRGFLVSLPRDAGGGGLHEANRFGDFKQDLMWGDSGRDLFFTTVGSDDIKDSPLDDEWKFAIS